ncbi:MAG: acetyl-CoA carboxylase carboxyl transferase subunit beta, partial [Clostridia bacterium]
MNNKNICPKCSYHLRINARQRIFYIADPKSFEEQDKNMISVNPLGFPEYDNKLENAKISSGEKDGVICGKCTIGGYKCAIFVMEPYFMMGS